MLDADPGAAKIIRNAMELGTLIERIQIRPFEVKVQSANRQLPGKKKAADVANADHRELHQKYQPSVDRLMTAGMKYYPATDQVGRELGVCGKTVRKYAPNPSPRRLK